MELREGTKLKEISFIDQNGKLESIFLMDNTFSWIRIFDIEVVELKGQTAMIPWAKVTTIMHGKELIQYHNFAQLSSFTIKENEDVSTKSAEG